MNKFLFSAVVLFNFVTLASHADNTKELKIHADFGVWVCDSNGNCHGTSNPFRVITITLKEVPQSPSAPFPWPYSGTWSEYIVKDGIRFYAEIVATDRAGLSIAAKTGPVVGNDTDTSSLTITASDSSHLNEMTLGSHAVHKGNNTYGSGLTIGLAHAN